MKKNVNLSIIIVNYKVRDKLIRCIESIISTSKKILYEIIIVDNEGDRTLEKKLNKYKNVIYLNPGKNLGYGSGNNYGEKKASGEYLFILNPDTIILKDAIKNLYNFSKKNKNVGAVSPLLLDNQKKTYSLQGTKLLTPLRAIFSLSFISKIFKNNKILNKYYIKDWDKKNKKEVGVVPGTAFMMKKKLYDEVKGFDENFFLYFEESDLCKRIKELDYKNYIVPSAKIIHEWGRSTKKLSGLDKIFKKSRFYYLKKHFGYIKSILTESILRVNSVFASIAIFVALSTSIIMYKIKTSMTFIGDQAWYYISAKEMVTEGVIPLVGITSSHTWLHQGAYWTYLMAPFLMLYNFAPISGMYLSIIINALTIIAIYLLSKKLFNKRVGLISATLYSFSPLVIIFSRMPYHTTPIPFFTILFINSILSWVKGDKKYFPLIFLFIGILYNFELATVSLFFIFILLLAYGVIKKTTWIKQIRNKQTILLAIFSSFISMLPVIIYDFYNGFPQTLKFIAWIGYKAISAVFPIMPVASNISAPSASEALTFFFSRYQELIYPYSITIATLFFVFSILNMLCMKNNKQSVTLVGLWLVCGIAGVVFTKTLSDAYLPILFPVFIISVAYLLNSVTRNNILLAVLLIFITYANLHWLFNSDKYISNDLRNREYVVDKIIQNSNGQSFSLLGKGEGSQFRSFLMPYEYLLWFKNQPQSKSNEELKYIITEHNGKILLEYDYNNCTY